MKQPTQAEMYAMIVELQQIIKIQELEIKSLKNAQSNQESRLDFQFKTMIENYKEHNADHFKLYDKIRDCEMETRRVRHAGEDKALELELKQRQDNRKERNARFGLIAVIAVVAVIVIAVGLFALFGKRSN